MTELRFAKLMTTRSFSPSSVLRHQLEEQVGKIVVVKKYGHMYHIPRIPSTMGRDGDDYQLLHN